MTVEYFIGDELSTLGIWWFADDTLVDFSGAHTYSAKLYAASDSTKTNVFASAKTTNITGSAGSGTPTSGTPNLSIVWATSGELNSVTTAGLYVLQIVATRTSDSRARTCEIRVQMRAR